MVVLVSVAIIVAYIWSVLKLARMSRAPRVDPAGSAAASRVADRSAGVPTGRRATSLPRRPTHHAWDIVFRRHSA
jgi:hypothetical protein